MAETTTTPPKPDSAVSELQTILQTYAKITGYTAADAGVPTGFVDVKTAMAVMAILPRVPGIPREVTIFMAAAPLLLASSDGRDSVFRLIKAQASYISKAIIALEVYRVGSGGAVAPTGTTATSTSIKSGTIWSQNRFDALTTAAAAVAPSKGPVAAGSSGGFIPGDPSAAIWFYDRWSKSYRVAVPRPGLNGAYTNYLEVASATSPPATGVQVDRQTFMSATGKWWWTPGGMAVIAGGVLGLGALTFAGARAVLR